jgi:hypothetical protein
MLLPGIGMLTQLWILYLSKNEIVDLPHEMVNLSDPLALLLDGNPLNPVFKKMIEESPQSESGMHLLK